MIHPNYPNPNIRLLCIPWISPIEQSLLWQFPPQPPSAQGSANPTSAMLSAKDTSKPRPVGPGRRSTNWSKDSSHRNLALSSQLPKWWWKKLISQVFDESKPNKFLVKILFQNFSNWAVAARRRMSMKYWLRRGFPLHVWVSHKVLGTHSPG